MQNLIAQLTAVSSPDPDRQRRGRNLIIVSSGVILILIVVGGTLTALQPTIGRLINLGLAIFVFGMAAVLGRIGWVGTGGSILLAAIMLGSLSGFILNPTSPFNAFYTVLGLLLASLLLKPWQIWIVLGVYLIGVIVVYILLPPATREQLQLNLAFAHLTTLLIVSALLSFIGAQSLNAALNKAHQAQQQAEASYQQLLDVNASLETRIAERTAELQRLLGEYQATAARLSAALEEQQQLHRTISELDIPIIPIGPGRLVMPLVGTLDQERAQRLLSRSLQAIEQYQARALIIDVTGVAFIDQPAAADLIKVSQAVRLMGATLTLSGIRPEVAQTLVSISRDVATIRAIESWYQQ